MIARHHKISLAKKRKFPNNPPPSLTLFELAPVVGVEKSIVVWHMEVLADQPEHLCFCPEGIVTDNKGCDAMLDLHFSLWKVRNIYFIKFLTSFVDKSKRITEKIKFTTRIQTLFKKNIISTSTTTLLLFRRWTHRLL